MYAIIRFFFIFTYMNHYLDRSITSLLLRLAQQRPAILITGPRQSGKTTLLKHCFAKTHTFLSLDSFRLREQAQQNPELFLSAHGERLIIDEIQYAPELFSYLKILIDSDRSSYGRFILTGSQQFPLMSKVSDSLAGRIAILELFPLSVQEKLHRTKTSFKTPLDMFVHSALRGSFPEVALEKKIDSFLWHKHYVETYLERDVRDLSQVQNITLFHQFLELLATQCSQILNKNRISSDLGVSIPTITAWLSILETSRLVYFLPAYTRSEGKRLRKRPKLYFTDIGIVCALLSISTKEAVISGPFSGALFENFCIQETLKVFSFGGTKGRLSYVRTSNNVEVDLLVESNGKVHPFEFKLNSTPKADMAKSLLLFTNLYPQQAIQQGVLVTPHAESFALTSESRHLCFLDFLEQIEAFA
jgi:uncharacterized protein